MIKKSLNGFTLIELLVVMAILSIVFGYILTIFTRTFHASNKSQIITNMKQNGQSILENIDRNTKNADKVVCISGPATTLVVSKAGVYTRYRFIAPTNSANGYIQQDSPAKQIVQATSREETDQEFENRVCAVNDPMTNAVVITNTQNLTGISINCISLDCNSNPIFKRDRLAGYKDQVTIRFLVEPALGISPDLKKQVDNAIFQTTINLR